jgi:hypothetical protein
VCGVDALIVKVLLPPVSHERSKSGGVFPLPSLPYVCITMGAGDGEDEGFVSHT